MKLILASTSKLKNEILDKVRMKHESINSDFEEKSSNKNNVYKYVKDLSFGKAKSVEEKVGQAIILGIDTIVYANEKILEKPKSLEEAKQNLKSSAGKTTSVITGITLINKYNNEIKPIIDTPIAYVPLNNLYIFKYGVNNCIKLIVEVDSPRP